MDYNQQYFSQKDIKSGLHIKFIQFLLDNFGSNDYRIDLHAYHEDGGIVVEWNRQLIEFIDEMGRFEFVACDEHIEKDND